MKRKNKVFSIFLYFFTIALAIFDGMLLQNYFNNHDITAKTFNKEADIFLIGNNISKEINYFFKFNLSNTGKKLSLEQLKQEGGVCEHYSQYAVSRAKNMGVYGKMVTIEGNGKLRHAFAVISNSHGYCIIDEQSVRCQHLEFENVK